MYGSQRILIIAAAVILCLSCDQRRPGSEDFRKYRTQYEATIDNAREFARKPEEPFNFKADWYYDHLAPERPNVCAVQTKSSMLFVCILTYNDHGGSKFGYIYTEKSMAPEKIDQLLNAYNCGVWRLTKKLNDNWWAAKISTTF